MSSNVSHGRPDQDTKPILLGNLNLRFPSEPSAHEQHDAGIGASACAVNLWKADTEPCPHTQGSPGQPDSGRTSIPSHTGQSRPFHHVCKTQPPLEDCLRSIYVGEKGKAYRFARNSVVTFNTNRGSFPCSNDADHATRSLDAAAREWNDGKFGVSFQKVEDNEPAVFRLEYKYKQHSLAKAFFPNRTLQRTQPKLAVYPSAFEAECYHNMVNVFRHELGRILGLRHEFAEEQEPRSTSVKFGDNNESSVMNYFDHPSKWRIQKSDYEGVKAFYAFSGSRYRDFAIEDVIPTTFTSTCRPHCTCS
ncbi:hypothetical protein GGR52DRAFT_398318 [Hypoxylon sp. FL1284]|nr:hypothetical protein GGR52DRAFT_398318 [Hypoxylon sp. FL1284]